MNLIHINLFVRDNVSLLWSSDLTLDADEHF